MDKKVTRALDGQPANVTEHFWFNFFEKVNKNIWQVVARKDLTIFDFTNLFKGAFTYDVRFLGRYLGQAESAFTLK